MPNLLSLTGNGERRKVSNYSLMSIITFNPTSTLIPDTELHGDELHESLICIGAALLTPLNNMNTKLTTEIDYHNTSGPVFILWLCLFIYHTYRKRRNLADNRAA